MSLALKADGQTDATRPTIFTIIIPRQHQGLHQAGTRYTKTKSNCRVASVTLLRIKTSIRDIKE